MAASVVVSKMDTSSGSGSDLVSVERSNFFKCRREGWQIANRVKHKDGAKHGSFRLAPPLTRPNPKSQISIPEGNGAASRITRPLFDVPERHRDNG